MGEKNVAEKTLTFEESLAELELLAEKLKTELPLEQALALYEQGVTRAAACQKLLQAAQNRVAVIDAPEEEQPA